MLCCLCGFQSDVAGIVVVVNVNVVLSLWVSVGCGGQCGGGDRTDK